MFSAAAHSIKSSRSIVMRLVLLAHPNVMIGMLGDIRFAYAVQCSKRELTCYGNGSSDVYPEVSDDSKVAAALEGSADAKLAVNITTAAEYAAYRTWALGLTGVTPEEVKSSSNAWLSYALDTDALIAAAPKEGEIVIDAFESAANEGTFTFAVKIDGITVGDGALEVNIRKVFDIEGVQDLATGTFTANAVEVNAATPQDGNVKFTVAPKGGALGTTRPTIFFFRVKMK